MPIQSYCNTCPHRKIPRTVKDKFNQNVKMMFSECPCHDPKVVGCFMSYSTIDWKAFVRWLDDNRNLTDEEKKNLKMIKMYEEKNA